MNSGGRGGGGRPLQQKIENDKRLHKSRTNDDENMKNENDMINKYLCQLKETRGEGLGLLQTVEIEAFIKPSSLFFP